MLTSSFVNRYINRKNIPICDAFFPNARHVTLDTGHWVQAEQPRDFVDELVKFVAK
jgi:pimeloyl-ACP methyl ester carboxylesterase